MIGAKHLHEAINMENVFFEENIINLEKILVNFATKMKIANLITVIQINVMSKTRILLVKTITNVEKECYAILLQVHAKNGWQMKPLAVVSKVCVILRLDAFRLMVL